MAVVEVTIVPVGTSSPSLSDYIAGALKVLEKKGIEYELTSTGTILEGDLDELLKVIKDMHNSVFNDKVSRVVTTVRIDDRRDKKLTIDGKKKSVGDKLQSN